MKPIVTGLLAVTCTVSLTANALLYLRYSSNRPLVTVGGQTITRKDYQDALDYQAGKAVLGKLVYTKLIRQAAAKAGVTPTDADVDARLSELRRRAPEALAQAALAPDFKQNLATDLALENLRIRQVTVGPSEVTAFYAQNRNLFTVPPQAQSTMVVTGNAVDAGTAAGLLRDNTPVDVIAHQPRLNVVGLNGFDVNFRALPPAAGQTLNRTILAMAPGTVKILPLAGHFLTVRVNTAQPGGVPPLARIRPQVTRLARLERAPSPQAELSLLYKQTKPRFQASKYESFFQDLETAPTRTASAR